MSRTIHPWSCYRNENGIVILTYEEGEIMIAISGITKKQIDSLREELKAFELLDIELKKDLKNITEKVPIKKIGSIIHEGNSGILLFAKISIK